jgi:hypothetical protein
MESQCAETVSVALESSGYRLSVVSAGEDAYYHGTTDLAAAEGPVRARANYGRTLIQYEEATNTLLDRNNIEMSDAVDGVKLRRRSDRQF